MKKWARNRRGRNVVKLKRFEEDHTLAAVKQIVRFDQSHTDTLGEI